MLITVLFLLNFNASAAWDAVGVFHKPEKVIVLLNERQEVTNKRLHQWVSLFPNNYIQYISSTQDIRWECGINFEGAGCTFRFLPSSTNLIGERFIESSLSIAQFTELGVDIQKMTGLDLSFLNSNGDTFRIWQEGDRIYFLGKKKSQ